LETQSRHTVVSTQSTHISAMAPVTSLAVTTVLLVGSDVEGEDYESAGVSVSLYTIMHPF